MPQHFKTTDYKIDDIHYFIVPVQLLHTLITSKNWTLSIKSHHDLCKQPLFNVQAINIT